MKIFFPKESEKETRSALDLASAQRLIDHGIEVSFESGVTQKIDIADQDLEDIGCKNESRSEGLSNSEIICLSMMLEFGIAYSVALKRN